MYQQEATMAANEVVYQKETRATKKFKSRPLGKLAKEAVYQQEEVEGDEDLDGNEKGKKKEKKTAA